MIAVLSIDGAASGAAAIVARSPDVRRLLCPMALRWGPADNNRVALTLSNRRRVFRNTVAYTAMVGLGLHELVKLAGDDDWIVRAVTIETQFMGKNPNTGLQLARTVGAMLGVMLGASPDWRTFEPPIRYLVTTTWRSDLGLAASSRDRAAAKAASLDFIPQIVDGAQDHLDLLGQFDDITDAIGVGAVGVNHRAWEGTALEFDDRIKASIGKPTRGQRREAKRARKARMDALAAAAALAAENPPFPDSDSDSDTDTSPQPKRARAPRRKPTAG